MDRVLHSALLLCCYRLAKLVTTQVLWDVDAQAANDVFLRATVPRLYLWLLLSVCHWLHPRRTSRL